MKKILSIFLILYMVLTNISTCFSQPIQSVADTSGLNIQADSAILIDAKTGAVLYEKNPDKVEFPASITKLMTVLLVMEYGKFDEVITFSDNAIYGIERNSSHIALDVGEQITMEQALYAMMLVSANEACLGVAEHISGSVEEFAKRMSERAKELGCTNTNFVNPNGLHNENHYTTARDMAIITQELLKYDKFREVAGTIYYEIPPTNKQPETRYLYGQHKMTRPGNGYLYDGCGGGKTGFTNEALNTLVTFAKRGDTELIAVTLKDTGSNTYIDTTALFDFGFNNYKTEKIFSADIFSKSIPVTETYEENIKDRGSVDLYADNDVYATLPIGTAAESVSSAVDVPNSLSAPVSANQEIGEIIFSLDGNILTKSKLFAKTAVTATPVEELKKEFKKPIFNSVLKIVIIAVIAIVVIFILILIIGEINYRRKIRMRRKKFRNRYKKQ